MLLFYFFFFYFSSVFFFFFFFFSSRRRHTRCLSDWSSDVCSSDLPSRIDHRPSGGRTMKTGTRILGALAVAFLVSPPAGRAQAPAPPAGVTAAAVLRADQPGAVVNKNIYGQDRKSVV